MSTAHGPARNRAVRQAKVEPPLRVVPRSAPRRPRAPFVVLVVALMAVGLIGLLLINTNMQRKAFELTSLQEQAESLQTKEQALRLEVDGLSSPDRIAQEAGRLGMVPNASPAFLRLEDGEVLGHPRAAMPGTNLPGLSASPVTTDDTATDETATDETATDETATDETATDEGRRGADDDAADEESDRSRSRDDDRRGGDEQRNGDDERNGQGGEHR